MKFVTAGLATVMVLALGSGPLARADALKLEQVSADAKWVGHVDCDAMRASTVVNKAWDKLMELDKGARGHLEKVRAELGMDLAQDLHCITVYGKTIGKEEGVLIAHAKFDRAKLEGMAPRAPDHKVVEAGPYKIHSWTMNDHGRSRPAAGAFRDDDLLVLSGSVDEVKAALAVLDGKAPAITEEGPLRGRIPPGTCALFRVTGIAEAKLPGKPALASQMESYRATIGENDGKVFYRARAIMTNEEIVGQLKTVLDGFRALGQIHVTGDAQGKAMLDATQVTTEGKNVTITCTVPAADVWDQIVKHGKIVIDRRRAHAAKAKGN
jgi:hypothetical protein